jgi:hypothetical protein
MAMLGAMPLVEETTDISPAEGEKWLRLAMGYGDRRAMTHLGIQLLKNGTPKGPPESVDSVALFNRACSGDWEWKATTTSSVPGDPLACYHLGVLYSTGAAGLTVNRERAGVAFSNVKWLARNSDSMSRDWYEIGNGIGPEIRRAAEKGSQAFDPVRKQVSTTDIWTLLIAATAALVIGQAILGGGGGSPSSQGDQGEERRRQNANSEAMCQILGGTWIPPIGPCHPN